MASSSYELKTLIVETGLRGRMFDFKEFSDCCHILDIFKLFGKQMTKIKIGEKDIQYKDRRNSKLDEIFRLISTYCSMDQLKHLDLEYFYSTSIKEQFMQAAVPFFRCVESLTITEICPKDSHTASDYFYVNPTYDAAIDELVERIIGSADKITSIELNNLKFTGRFFYNDHVQRNLKNLKLFGCNVRAPDDFISFLQKKPKLKSFFWHNSSLYGLDSATMHSSNIVYKLVANNVTDLETLHYSPNEGFLNDRNQWDTGGMYLKPEYELIRKFRKLKVLKLEAITIDGLKLLAEMNQVEKLEANLLFESVDSQSDFHFLLSYTNLKSVKFHTYHGAYEKHLNYLAKLPRLTECHITTTILYDDFNEVIVKAVASAKDLSILRISTTIGHFYNELYLELLLARLAHGFSTKPLRLKMKDSKSFICRLGENYRPDVIKVQEFDWAFD